MMEQNVIRYLDGFYEFCDKHSCIYLYGAGKIGKRYLQILKFMKKSPKGFIVSDGQEDDVEGIPVIPADKVRGILTNEVGVIGAFKNADEKLIRAHLGVVTDIYVPPIDFLFYWSCENILFPFLEKSKYPSKTLQPMSSWKNILIVRLDVLGDLIMSTPFLREIRRNCPDSHITLVVRPSNKALFESCPYISELLLYECLQVAEADTILPCSLQLLLERIVSFANSKLKRHYDVVFNLCTLLNGRSSVESILLAYAVESDCKVGRIYYREKLQERFYYLKHRFSKIMSLVSADSMPKHEVVCMLDLLRRCGGIVHNEQLELWFRLNKNIKYLSLFNKKINVFIAVGVVGRMQCQCWPADRYKELFGRLSRIYPHIGFILLGGSEAITVAKEITNDDGLAAHVLNLTGKTSISEVATVINACVLYVGSNTGLMHIAAALEKPVVEIDFYVRNKDGSINSPMGPWGVSNIILQKMGIDDCLEICSKAFPHCITQITVEEVSEAVEKMLCAK